MKIALLIVLSLSALLTVVYPFQAREAVSVLGLALVFLSNLAVWGVIAFAGWALVKIVRLVRKLPTT